MRARKALKIRSWLGLACLIFVQAELRSAFAREDVVPGSRYTSARAAAMGDAYLPIGDDAGSGLFYNPADLARVRIPQLEPLNFSTYANGQFVNMLSFSNFYQGPSLSGYAPTLKANPGQNAGFGAAIMPSYAMHDFSFGILYQNQMRAVAQPDGTIQYRSLYQLIPTLGYGMRFASGIVRVGYSLQWVNQASGTITDAPGTSPLGYNQSLAQGAAFSHNVGFALTLPIEYLPSLNLTARNILGAKFSMSSIYSMASNPNGQPPDEPMTIDAALGFQPKMGHGNYMNLVLEYRDLTNTSGVTYWGRAAAGAEFSFGDAFYLRGGWGSGYPAAGFGIKRKSGEFGLAWYSEEIGSGYHDQRDIRYLLQFQVRAF